MYSRCFPHQDLPTIFHMPGIVRDVRDTMSGVAPFPRELTFTMEEETGLHKNSHQSVSNADGKGYLVFYDFNDLSQRTTFLLDN